MYRSIVVPLDGSATSEQAIPLALTIARKTGATLHLVNAQAPLPVMAAGALVVNDIAWQSAGADRAQAYLDDVARRLESAGAVSHTVAVVAGTPAEAIVQHALTNDGDLIVMATHGLGGVRRLWLGSVADGVIRHSPIPVLLVRPADTPPPALDAEQRFAHLLVAVDGSPFSEQVLPHASALGALDRATITLLHVIAPPPLVFPENGLLVPIPANVLAELREAARSQLESLAASLRADGFTVNIVIQDGGPPAEAILEYEGAPPVDLIALTTHARGPVGRLLLGSVADKVVRASAVPVLLYRPAG